MRKEDLDRRICDVEPPAENTETYREYMTNAYREFFGPGIPIPDYDSMSEEELNDRLEELDWLWSK